MRSALFLSLSKFHLLEFFILRLLAQIDSSINCFCYANCDVFYDIRWVLEECKRQQLAEKREQIFLEKRGILMEKVAKIEIELQEALKYRQMTMADIM